MTPPPPHTQAWKSHVTTPSPPPCTGADKYSFSRDDRHTCNIIGQLCLCNARHYATCNKLYILYTLLWQKISFPTMLSHSVCMLHVYDHLILMLKPRYVYNLLGINEKFILYFMVDSIRKKWINIHLKMFILTVHFFSLDYNLFIY